MVTMAAIPEKLRIEGTYDQATWFGIVRVNGLVLNPRRSLRLRNHSPTGFAWGYAGSGPAQLSLAILLEAGLTDDDALDHYQAFKFTFIAQQARDSFSIEVPLAAWLDSRRIVVP